MCTKTKMRKCLFTGYIQYPGRVTTDSESSGVLGWKIKMAYFVFTLQKITALFEIVLLLINLVKHNLY